MSSKNSDVSLLSNGIAPSVMQNCKSIVSITRLTLTLIGKHVDERGRWQTVFSIDGALINEISELPDIAKQSRIKFYQKGHNNEFFSEKMTSGNSEVTFLVGVRRTLMANQI